MYLKVAIFKPELRGCAPRTTFVLKSCDFQAGAAADQGGIEPATAGLRKQARKPRDNFQRPFREQEYCTAPQPERFDAHDLRRGSRAASRNRKKSSVFEPRPRESLPGRARPAEIVKSQPFIEPRPRESPQRVARPAEIVKSPQFLNLDHANLRRRSRAHRRNRKSPQFLNLDHANLRRGSRAHAKNRKKKSSVFEPRPRESPQRVAIPSDDQTPAPAP